MTASADVGVSTVAGTARHDATANPKRPNTPRRETNSDAVFSLMITSLIRGATELPPVPSRFNCVRSRPEKYYTCV